MFARVALTLALVTTSSLALAQLAPQLPHLPEHHLESRLLTLTNEARAGAGVAPLAHSAVLAQAARHHARPTRSASGGPLCRFEHRLERAPAARHDVFERLGRCAER